MDNQTQNIHTVILPNNFKIGFTKNTILLYEGDNQPCCKINFKTINNTLRDKIVKECLILKIYYDKKIATENIQSLMVEIEKKYNLKINWDKYKETHNITYGKFGCESSPKIIIPGIDVKDYLNNIQSFYKKYPFFYDNNKILWSWNDNLKKYEMGNEIDLMNQFEKYMKFEGETIPTIIKNDYRETLKRVGRMNIPKPAPDKWIQFKDKAYSLNSKLIYEVQPNYFFTNPIPWDIGESEDTPMIDKLFIDWVGEDGKQSLYEILAYCCYSDYPIHLIFCFVGIGRNGKSSFLSLLEKFIGKDNCCSTELDTLLDNRFESFKLYKKLVCTMGETNFNIISKTSILKKLTGQDLVGFECKNKMPFDDHNYAKILISSNSLPSSNDTSDGFYRRWFIINWNKSFPEGKNPVNDIPDQEYKNLARKACRLVSELLERYTFTGIGSIEERKIKYIEASNPLSLFIEKYCYEDVNGYIRYSELYTRYVNYLNENKKRVINKREFTKVLEMEGHEVRRTTLDGENSNWIFGLKKKDLLWN